MKSVLFVCLGNICRSPTAEAVLVTLAERRGHSEQIRVESAGTGNWHVGGPPDERMRRTAAKHGYRLDGAARQVLAAELGQWDLVVAMDRDNLARLQELGGGDNLRLFSDFLPAGAPIDVPDPYFGGADGFDRVVRLIEQGCPAILDALLAG